MEIDPFLITIDGRKFVTFPHDEDRAEYLVEHPEIDPRDVAILMVSIFRQKGYMDMVEVVEIDEVADDFHTHVILGRTALVDWLVGFSLDEERQEELRHTESVAGKFGEKFGWYATVTLEDEPAEYQEAVYMKWSLRDLESTFGVPEDFYDDGA
jgi:hypothetical protein